ncbi:MAG: molybdopterin molybdotransferase MoeA [Bacteroidetes bacterium]|nr:molybdopterin molybdotransferase MoeA [Bacteroidota bacterium]
MITVTEAKRLTTENAKALEPCITSLLDASGFILAEDIFSTIDVPSFNQSAMDGYGFRFDDLKENQALEITGEIPAGVFPTEKLLPNTAVRIFTGAMVPEGCDTIVMQEKVSVQQNQLLIHDAQIKKGMNIRLQGSQTLKGNLALKAGSKITPGAAGFLAGIGCDKIKVFRKPSVCIITTGKELNKPGQTLEPGKVFECNSYSINAALSELNIKPKNILSVDDDEIEISQAIENNLSACDVMILSGGVSVGDYDFVHTALEKCGVQKVFHKVKQKPGKPIYFGKYKNTLIFGLPGNPSALLTCYYEYIAPVLKTMMGFQIKNETKLQFPLAADFSKKEGLTFFLKGKLSEHEVAPLQGQESYQMNSFAFADCIIQLEENKTEFRKGDLVEVHLLNQH